MIIDILLHPLICWIVNYVLFFTLLILFVLVFRGRKVIFPLWNSMPPFSKSNTIKLALLDNGMCIFKRTDRRKGQNFDSDGTPMQEFKSEKAEDEKGRVIKPVGRYIQGTGIKLQVIDENGMLPYDEKHTQVPLEVLWFDRITELRALMKEKEKNIFKKGLKAMPFSQIIAFIMFIIIIGALVYFLTGLFF